MNKKKVFAAALALLLTLTLLPGASAQEIAFPTEWFSGLSGSLSLRDLIDGSKKDIEIAGSSFQLENILFIEDCAVNEDTELCVCETAKDAMILDTSALPAGLEAEIRREKVRFPDAKDGLRVAEEIRLEKQGRTPEPIDDSIDPADADREAWYLYLTGKPRETGSFIFILWDGKLRLVEVEVLPYKPEETAPAVTEEWVDDIDTPADNQNWGDPAQPEQTWSDPGVPTQEWADTDVPMTMPPEEPQSYDTPEPTVPPTPEPTPTLPTPSVRVTGSTRVEQGETAVLEASVENGYNLTYQWYVGNEPLSDANASRYMPDTSYAGTWVYTCLVTSNGYGQTTYAFSDPVSFTVDAKPVLPAPSVIVKGSTVVQQGAMAVLEAQATDVYNASYQWYQDGSLISGATGSQYRPDTASAGTHSYVVGVTSNGYGQTNYAYSDPVSFTVEARPSLPTPTVTITGGNSCYTGDSVVLTARVNNGSNLSYQWYTGMSYYNAPIPGATDSQYRPDTAKAGTWTYYVEVTSSNGYEEVSVLSDPLTFVVTAKPAATAKPAVNKTVSGISVAKLPNNVDYYDGDTVDTGGLQLRVRYTDGSYDIISSGFVVTTPTVSYNSSGLANIKVNYRGYETSYQVKVHSYSELIRSIGVLTMPRKTSYNVGDWLDTTGLTIRVYSTDGRYLDIGEGFECSPTRLNTAGNQAVTVSFGGKTCTFTVAVQQARTVYGLSVQSQPANRSYTVGDTINTAGLTLQVQTNSGYETVTSGYTISPRVATTAGTQQITVNYEGMSTTFTVNVSDNIPRATPTPAPTPNWMNPTPTPYGATPSPLPYGTTPSPTPYGATPGLTLTTPTPTPTATPTYTPARKNTGVGTLVKVLFGVAVLSLIGLIGYVLYLRRQDGDDEYAPEEKLSEKLHRLFTRQDDDR